MPRNHFAIIAELFARREIILQSLWSSSRVVKSFYNHCGALRASRNHFAIIAEPFARREIILQSLQSLFARREIILQSLQSLFARREIARNFRVLRNASQLQKHIRKVKHSIRKCKRLRDFFPLFLLSLFLFFHTFAK